MQTQQQTIPPPTLRREFLEKICKTLEAQQSLQNELVGFLMTPMSQREREELEQFLQRVCDRLRVSTGNMRKTVHNMRALADDYFQLERRLRDRQRDLEIVNARLIFKERNEKALMEKVEKGKYDQLTGLLTREKFTEQFVDFLMHEKRRNFSALLFIDFKKFKSINDMLGHEKGDVALRRIGFFLTQLRSSEGDLVGRWGGDEFVVMIHGQLDMAQVKQIVERVQRAIWHHDWHTEFEADYAGVAADIGGVGWTEVSQPQADREWVEESLFKPVLDRADQLMYAAKAKGVPEGGAEFEEWILDRTFFPKEEAVRKTR